MIIGECPYEDCGEGFMIPIAESAPTYEKRCCEKCQRVIWTMHSRFSPWSMTEAEFHDSYIVDEGSKRVIRRAESKESGQ